VKADAVPDARGAAIKVQDVSGEFILEGTTDPAVQDFVMANHPAFIARDVKDYLRLQRARLNAVYRPLTMLEALTRGTWDPQQWYWKETLATATVLTQFPVHPACQTYYSMVPIRFGNYIAKYRLKLMSRFSVSSLHFLKTLATQADAFRILLAETLRASSLTFEFQVQLRTNAQSMPIEDASATWPEAESPYRTVARLMLPQQELNSSAWKLGDELSFSVWNALAAHRPLGGMNRVRKAAYDVSAAWRRARQDSKVGGSC